MTIRKDPEQNETAALFSMVDFKDTQVLEIGVGDGRFTWRFADRAAHVTALDPDAQILDTARSSLPVGMEGRVTFLESTIEAFSEQYSGRAFDIAIFSWSL
jgi:ubiquinone/menaquinone biosynthesis C-methylase UbiE